MTFEIPFPHVRRAHAGLVLAFAALWTSMPLASPVMAAGEKSDCCGALEERIADLETGAARSRPRKAALTASGAIDQEVTYWNDGDARDVYLTGLASQVAHFKFGSDIKVSPELSVGFLIRSQFFTSYPFLRLTDGDGIDQTSDERDFGADTHQVYWYAAHRDVGKVTLGRQSNAAKSPAMLTDQSGTQRFDNPTMLTGFPQFIVRSNGDLEPSGLTWAEFSFCHSRNMPLGSDCNGIALNGIRYDSPSLNGLVFSASWGTDDFWEGSLRYTKETKEWKVALGAGYSHSTDETQFGRPPYDARTSDYVQAGAYVEHLATGLFLNGIYGYEDNHDAALRNGKTLLDGEHWGIKAGVRGHWNSFGATVLYGDYTVYHDQLGATALALGFTSSRFERLGAGIAQEFDQAAMTLYLKIQHYQVDATGAGLDASFSHLEDASFISIGDLITF